jgi:hypothetical protein
MQVKAANHVALRLEFEEARLARFRHQTNLAATQGRRVHCRRFISRLLNPHSRFVE